jgi:hypothetical protein
MRCGIDVAKNDSGVKPSLITLDQLNGNLRDLLLCDHLVIIIDLGRINTYKLVKMFKTVTI